MEALRANLATGAPVREPAAVLAAVVTGFDAVDDGARRGLLPAAWRDWQRFRIQQGWNGADAHPARTRRQLDAAGDPPPLTRRVPGASGR